MHGYKEKASYATIGSNRHIVFQSTKPITENPTSKPSLQSTTRFTYNAAYLIMSFILGLVVTVLAFYTTAAVSGIFFNQFINIVSNLAILIVAVTVFIAIAFVFATRNPTRKEY